MYLFCTFCEKNPAAGQYFLYHISIVVSKVVVYQEIIRKSDVYSNKLDALQLPKETRLLIDQYVSEQNALGSRYGMLAYLLGFSDCKELFIEKSPFSNVQGMAQMDEA